MAGGKFPDMPFNQQMSIPCELTLRKLPEGIRLYRVPVREIAELRSPKYSLKNAPLPAGQNASSYLSAELFEIQAEIELGRASEVGFALHGNDLVYNVDENILSCRGQKMKMAPANGRIRLTILTDRTSIEVFSPDSWITMHLCFPLDPDNKYFVLCRLTFTSCCKGRTCGDKTPLSPFMSPFCLHPLRLRFASMAFVARTADTMETMRKPWVYKRKNIRGWRVGWYEGSKRKAKAFPTKSLAEHFRHIKYTQLNSDVFTSIVKSEWSEMVEEYRRTKQVEGLKETSIYEALLTLGHFERLVSPECSRGITQNALDQFVSNRGKEVSKTTLNKDIRNLTAFLNWAAKNRFVTTDLGIRKVKVDKKPVTALYPDQVCVLLNAVSEYPTLRLRVLLAITTGLRRGDIEAICVSDIHFDRHTIATRNRKAGKAMPERPIPEEVMIELSNYVATIPDGQERLFVDNFSSKRWKRIRKALGLPDLKFHDLRKTFASLLAQKGVSTAVTQRLLEHSSPQLTNDVYTNVDPVLRQAVGLLPVAEWL